MPRPPTLAQCQRALVLSINSPSREWVGRCHEVCARLLELSDVVDSPIEGRLEGATIVRGRWAGPRSGGVYPPEASDEHSWLRLADGRLFDPTCWAFTSRTPVLTIAESSDPRWASGNSV